MEMKESVIVKPAQEAVPAKQQDAELTKRLTELSKDDLCLVAGGAPRGNWAVAE